MPITIAVTKYLWHSEKSPPLLQLVGYPKSKLSFVVVYQEPVIKKQTLAEA